VEVAAGITEEAAVAAALSSPRIHEALAGAEPTRVVARPPRLVNIVV
jgi:leucyl-tRNA synthetase